MEKRNSFKFNGSGSELFGIYVVNMILSAITFGIYAAWAKAKRLRYMYQNTDFAGDVFRYHGTGKEIFIGFLKFMLIMVLLYAVYMVGSLTYNQTLIIIGSIILFGGLLVIVPLAIHGGLRYRMARTSWRGIHWGYRGIKKELMSLYLKGVGLSIITFGVYGSWFEAKLYKYILSNIRFGDIKLSWDGNGKDLFFIYLKGILLTMITFGIYSFWYQKNLFNYFYNHIKATQSEVLLKVESTLTAGTIFKTLLINGLLVTFTFGLGYPWAVVRIMKMYAENLVVLGDFDPDKIVQTEEDYKDATGEGFLDAFDIGEGLF